MLFYNNNYQQSYINICSLTLSLATARLLRFIPRCCIVGSATISLSKISGRYSARGLGFVLLTSFPMYSARFFWCLFYFRRILFGRSAAHLPFTLPCYIPLDLTTAGSIEHFDGGMTGLGLIVIVRWSNSSLTIVVHIKASTY